MSGVFVLKFNNFVYIMGSRIKKHVGGSTRWGVRPFVEGYDPHPSPSVFLKLISMSSNLTIKDSTVGIHDYHVLTQLRRRTWVLVDIFSR